MPVSFVPLFLTVSSSISDFTVALLFTHVEVSNIFCAIIVDSCTIADDLSILKLPFELVTVSHDQDAFTGLLSLIERALVLEERVGVSVTALTLSQFCYRICISNVTVLGISVFNTAFLNHHLVLIWLHGLVLYRNVH